MAWTEEELKAFRKTLGMTQAEFAALIGVSLGTIKYWETGGRVPQAMCNYLSLLQKHPPAERELQPA